MYKRLLLFFMVLSLFVFLGCTGQIERDVDDINSKLDDNPDKVVVYFFWGEGCPHCKTQEPFLEALENNFEEVQIKSFETWNNEENARIIQDLARVYDTFATGVPMTFIGDEFWTGVVSYETMVLKVEECLEYGCVNPGARLLDSFEN